MAKERIDKNLKSIVKTHTSLRKIKRAFLAGQREFHISDVTSGSEETIFNCFTDIFNGSFIISQAADSCRYSVINKKSKRNELLNTLREYNYCPSEDLDKNNEYLLRGDVIYLFNAAYKNIIRIDFWGDEIEEMNLVDFVSKRKLRNINEIIFSNDEITIYNPELFFSEVVIYNNSHNIEYKFDFTDVPSFHSNIDLISKFVISENKAGKQVFIASSFQNRLNKIRDIAIFIDEKIRKGWQSESLNTVVLTDFELFDTIIPPVSELTEEWLTFQSLNIGDYVVHKNHGIAIYGGMKTIKFEGNDLEYLILYYAQNDKLYVPINQLNYVSKFIGISRLPKITRLGTQNWDKLRNKVKKAIKNIALELLDLYARREIKKGYAFSKNTDLLEKLINTFPFKETVDQRKAWEEIKVNMESERPMDRILVGDVGFGKTELAIRAALKAVQDEKQVAVLAPTTILVEQHYSVFKKRLNNFPVNIEVLSRFKDENEVEKILHKLEIGLIDIVIGTHRLLSKDVKFKDLGLLIIDEEQKFGVEQKEHMKYLRKEIDVLSMTATPIPRSLNMSLSGIKEISVLLQPPDGRKPIKTFLYEFEYEKIIEAIKKEVSRGGQVYIVHNQVKTIDTFTENLKKKVPAVNFVTGHGQMPAERLSKVMRDFIEKRFDVLVCSTIIENGLDMPDVNTIIIDDAHKFGLAQLHQLRGRVGRSERESYCYLFYPKGKTLSEVANSRLETIISNQVLGSGFNISTKDLELRGAGNLLGRDQSGNINAIGYALYIQLLREEIKKLKNLSLL